MNFTRVGKSHFFFLVKSLSGFTVNSNKFTDISSIKFHKVAFTSSENLINKFLYEQEKTDDKPTEEDNMSEQNPASGKDPNEFQDGNEEQNPVSRRWSAVLSAVSAGATAG